MKIIAISITALLLGCAAQPAPLPKEPPPWKDDGWRQAPMDGFRTKAPPPIATE